MPRSPLTVFLALALGVASLSSLQSLVIPVLPEMQRELGTTAAGINWTLTAWLIAAAVATPLIGRVGDLLGRRSTLLVVAGVVAIGDLVAFAAPDLSVLLVGRVLQGVGAALFPLAFGVLRETFPRERVASAIGAMSAVIAIGSGLGTVIAGPLATALGWRGLFLLPFALVVTSGILSFIVIPRSTQREHGRINVPAGVLLSAWLVALLLPLSNGAVWGWTSPLVLGLFGLAVVLIVAWVAVELRSVEPLVDLRLMRAPAIWSTNLASFLLGGAMFAVFAFFARFVQTPSSTGYGLGATVAQSGLLMLPMLITMAVAGFVSGPLGSRIGFRAQFGGGAALLGLASVGLGLLHSAAWQVAVEAGLFGLGLGIAYAAMTSLIVQSVPTTQTGIATGVNANLRTIGGAIVSSVVTVIVFAHVDATGLPFEAGYTAAFLTAAALAGVSALIALLVRQARRRGAVDRDVAVLTAPLTLESEAAA
ncbi:MFS transporter [Schumannella sp. 10F1B-5-1]|uniref:MFS transporter n=1 Tax=Schumannella sp. 10F1B-5-1 TaxID=2590780 RepID=UPI001131B86D|nr:MFS transporter [Schumannella sp. 10F1B-5-1]TPW73005.1 MFS transporter [Schumannella sp. 10F1B-5-1]